MSLASWNPSTTNEDVRYLIAESEWKGLGGEGKQE